MNVMEEAINTGFVDKTGRTIYVGDFVQHRLGKYGMSGGNRNYRVIQYGKKYHLVDESQVDFKYGGTPITQKITEYLVVVDSKYPRL